MVGPGIASKLLLEIGMVQMSKNKFDIQHIVFSGIKAVFSGRTSSSSNHDFDARARGLSSILQIPLLRPPPIHHSCLLRFFS